MFGLCAAFLWAVPAFGMSRKPPRDAAAKEHGAMNLATDLTVLDADPSEWRGQNCAESEPSARVIDSVRDWERLWRVSLTRVAPPVDFAKYVAAAVFLGSRSTGGYSIDFLEPLADDANVRFRYKVRKPASGAFVIQAFTQPYAIKLYRKTGKRAEAAEEK